jgi:AcrR family transcriptional regulator
MSARATSRVVPRRPTRRERGAATRGRVLDAAESLFATRGFAGTGLREIARKAGIQQPSLYRHFAGKAELYAAVLDRALRPILEALEAALDDDPDAIDHVVLLSGVLDALGRYPNVPLLLLHEVTSAEGRLEPELRRSFQPVIRRAARIITRASNGALDQEETSLWLVTLFFAGAGYFAAAPILELVGGGDPRTPGMRRRHQLIMTHLQEALRRRMSAQPLATRRSRS